jgi:hypothetical protein
LLSGGFKPARIVYFYVRSRSRFDLLTNLIAAAKTVKVLRNEKTKDGEQKEKKTAGDRTA